MNIAPVILGEWSRFSDTELLFFHKLKLSLESRISREETEITETVAKFIKDLME